MSRRMIKAGHEVWGYRRNYEKAQEQFEAGYISGCTASLESLVQVVHSNKSIFTDDSRSPGVFMMVVPAELVEETINELLQFCMAGDIIIDHGNSNFKDTRRRADRSLLSWAYRILTVVLVVVFTVWSVDTVLWLAVQILQYPSALLSSGHSHLALDLPLALIH